MNRSRSELSVKSSVPRYRMLSYSQGLRMFFTAIAFFQGAAPDGKTKMRKNLAMTWRIHFQSKTVSS